MTGTTIKGYADFDAQMSAVKAVGVLTPAELGALRQAAIDMGADTVYSATEAAQRIENRLKAGVSVRDIIGALVTLRHECDPMEVLPDQPKAIASAQRIAEPIRQANPEGIDQ